MDLNYEFTNGKRINSKLVYTSDRHLFKKSSKNDLREYYNCYVFGCKARIKIENDKCSYVQDNVKHVHGSQDLTYEQLKLETKIKSRCASEKKRPKEIFDEECLKNQKVSSEMQFSKRSRSLVYHQTQKIPKIPKTIAEVKSFFENSEILRTLGVTLDEEPKTFFYETVITSNFAYQIYFSEKILEFLPLNLKMRIDGTFKVVPKGPFKQLLVINIEFRDHVSLFHYI